MENSGKMMKHDQRKLMKMMNFDGKNDENDEKW